MTAADFVAPPARRSRVIAESGGTRVVVPARRNPIMLAFLGFWLIAWMLGEVLVAGQLLSGNAPGILFLWLAFWTVGGVFAAASFLWQLGGHEEITIGPEGLALAMVFPGYLRRRAYALAQVARLRASEAAGWSNAQRFNRHPFFGMGQGAISFDYGYRTFRFGRDLDEAEAVVLVRELLARHPSLGQAVAAQLPAALGAAR
jgi:hypothetical protein